MIVPELQKTKNHTIIKERILFALTLEFPKLPVNFFDCYVLDSIFGCNLSITNHKRISLNGLILLNNLLKFIGTGNKKIIDDSDIQFKVLLAATCDHESKMKQIDKSMMIFATEIRDLDLVNECAIDSQIIKNILTRRQFEFKIGKIKFIST